MADATVSHRMLCTCHTATHFLQVDYDIWDKYPDDISITMCADRTGGFWARLRRAWSYVFGGQELVVADILVSPQTAIDAGTFLVGVGNAAKRHAEQGKEAV